MALDALKLRPAARGVMSRKAKHALVWLTSLCVCFLSIVQFISPSSSLKLASVTYCTLANIVRYAFEEASNENAETSEPGATLLFRVRRYSAPRRAVALVRNSLTPLATRQAAAILFHRRIAPSSLDEDH
jgi:hypothetical protein